VGCRLFGASPLVEARPALSNPRFIKSSAAGFALQLGGGFFYFGFI